jgi:hypothetical protein
VEPLRDEVAAANRACATLSRERFGGVRVMRRGAYVGGLYVEGDARHIVASALDRMPRGGKHE